MQRTVLIVIYFCIIIPSALSVPVRTTKGGDLVALDGYEYRKKGVSADGSVQFWACTKKDCNGRAHSPIGTENLIHKGTHKHDPDPILNEVISMTVRIFST